MTDKEKESRQLDRSIGQRLKLSREQKELSLSDLCKLIPGTPSPSYLNRVENGERRAISTKLLQNWCETLGISFFQLLNVPEDADEARTFFDLVVLYKYTVGDGIESTPEIGAAIAALIEQVINSDFRGEKSYQDTILILERAKELIRLI